MVASEIIHEGQVEMRIAGHLTPHSLYLRHRAEAMRRAIEYHERRAA
jgi:hypothetical protein